MQPRSTHPDGQKKSFLPFRAPLGHAVCGRPRGLGPIDPQSAAEDSFRATGDPIQGAVAGGARGRRPTPLTYCLSPADSLQRERGNLPEPPRPRGGGPGGFGGEKTPFLDRRRHTAVSRAERTSVAPADDRETRIEERQSRRNSASWGRRRGMREMRPEHVTAPPSGDDIRTAISPGFCLPTAASHPPSIHCRPSSVPLPHLSPTHTTPTTVPSRGGSRHPPAATSVTERHPSPGRHHRFVADGRLPAARPGDGSAVGCLMHVTGRPVSGPSSESNRTELRHRAELRATGPSSEPPD